MQCLLILQHHCIWSQAFLHAFSHYLMSEQVKRDQNKKHTLIKGFVLKDLLAEWSGRKIFMFTYKTFQKCCKLAGLKPTLVYCISLGVGLYSPQGSSITKQKPQIKLSQFTATDGANMLLCDILWDWLLTHTHTHTHTTSMAAFSRSILTVTGWQLCCKLS